ncbi:NTP pyrophosphohydrolase [Streptomyces sp. NPDC052496]|uniref:NTP pyrophosphohydrolase n=1 Tax=Streptomyces sp. NPDC052496 TaxID=3154951 RepID=UPI003428B756
MSEPVERVDEQDRVVGAADRGEAICRRWPHRVATVVCRAAEGGEFVHRRPDDVSRFPGQYNWLTFLRRGAISPYWLGVHEAGIADGVAPGRSEVAWHDWLPESALGKALRLWPFVPDGREAFTQYAVRRAPGDG